MNKGADMLHSAQERQSSTSKWLDRTDQLQYDIQELWHGSPQDAFLGSTPYLQVEIIRSTAWPLGSSIHYTLVPEFNSTNTQCLRTIVRNVQSGSGGQVLIVVQRMSATSSVTRVAREILLLNRKTLL